MHFEQLPQEEDLDDINYLPLYAQRDLTAYSGNTNPLFFEDESMKNWRKIGQGNFGESYLVSVGSAKLVAKINKNKNFSKEFSAEIAGLRKLSGHSNILQLVGITQTIEGKQCYLVEFAEMGSLDELHGRYDFTDPKLFFRIIFGLFCGLQWMHSNGIIHRDIACRNLLLTNKFDVQIADFGLIMNGEGKDVSRTPLAWAWTAPESLRSRVFSFRSDIYSAGVTMWELITRGKIPYCVSGSIREQTKAIVSGKLQLKDSLPKLVVDSGRETDEKVIEFENSERFGILKEHVGDDLKFMENIIRKCLDHDRGKRPDAIDMVAELFPRIERLDRLEVGRSSESKKGLDLKDNPRPSSNSLPVKNSKSPTADTPGSDSKTQFSTQHKEAKMEKESKIGETKMKKRLTRLKSIAAEGKKAQIRQSMQFVATSNTFFDRIAEPDLIVDVVNNVRSAMEILGNTFANEEKSACIFMIVRKLFASRGFPESQIVHSIHRVMYHNRRIRHLHASKQYAKILNDLMICVAMHLERNGVRNRNAQQATGFFLETICSTFPDYVDVSPEEKKGVSVWFRELATELKARLRSLRVKERNPILNAPTTTIGSVLKNLCYTLTAPLSAPLTWFYRQGCQIRGTSAFFLVLLLVSIVSIASLVVQYTSQSDATYTEAWTPIVIAFMVGNVSEQVVLGDHSMLADARAYEFDSDTVKDASDLFEKQIEYCRFSEESFAFVEKISSISHVLADIHGSTKETFSRIEKRWQPDVYSLVLYTHANLHDRMKWLYCFLVGVIIGCVPGMIQLRRGQSFFPGGSGFIVALTYFLVCSLGLTWLLFKVHLWFKVAAYTLYKFSAIGDMSSSSAAKRYGLKLFIRLNSPQNLQAWLSIRRRVFNQMKEKLQSVFPINLIIAPLVVVVVLVVVGVVENGQIFALDEKEQIIRFALLILLSLYSILVLYTAAYANHSMNDVIIDVLTSYKFSVCEQLWKSISNLNINHKKSRRDEERARGIGVKRATEFFDEKELGNSREEAPALENGFFNPKLNRLASVDASHGLASVDASHELAMPTMESITKPEVKEETKAPDRVAGPLDEKSDVRRIVKHLDSSVGLLNVDVDWIGANQDEGRKMETMKFLLEAASERVARDQSLTLKMYGIDISFGLMVSLASALVTLIAAGTLQATDVDVN